MRLLLGMSFIAGYLAGVLWLAQLTAWGLSLFRVSSGIWGPFLLILVASSVATGAALAARGGRR